MRAERVAIVVALAGCAKPAAEEAETRPPAAVTCAPVTAGDVHDVVELTGTIAPPPRLDAVMSSPVAGRVSQVSVDEGDKVAAGALLATVEDPALPAGAVEARAQVAAAKAAKTAAELEVARQTRLVESGVGARKDLDEANGRLAAANAELEAAGARVGLADRQLARRDLRAPYAGVVLHVWKRAGESVDGTTATPILEVADVSRLELRAQVSPRALVGLADNMPASVTVLGLDAPIAGTIARVSPAVDPTTLLGNVRIALDPQTHPPVGSAATARVTVKTRPGVSVPPAALRRSITGSDEVVACDKGVARVKPVTVGVREGDRVEIASGLAAGDSIVVDRPLGLDDGQAIKADK